MSNMNIDDFTVIVLYDLKWEKDIDMDHCLIMETLGDCPPHRFYLVQIPHISHYQVEERLRYYKNILN